MVSVPKPAGSAPNAVGWEFRRDTKRRERAREALVKVLWGEDGQRRLPTDAALCDAIEACQPGDLWWVCEASSAGPLYLLPTVEWLDALSHTLRDLGVQSVLEVACGDGFLSQCLRARRPDLVVTATDDGSWARPSGRMSAADRRETAGVAFAGIRAASHVQRMKAAPSVAAFKPDLVLVSWPPPGRLVEQVIGAPDAQLVLDISTDGDICGNGMATWRFNKEFLEGPVESLALCRLDDAPRAERHTRVTQYYGRAHPEYAVD